MPREKQYETPAQRQAAYRERKRLEAMPPEAVDPDLPVVDLSAPDPPSTERALPPMPTLEDYVSDALLGAEIAFGQASPNATLSTKTLAETLERAEAYARFRYQGVLDGSVNGL